MLDYVIYIHYLILRQLSERCYYSHWTDEEVKAQRKSLEAVEFQLKSNAMIPKLCENFQK